MPNGTHLYVKCTCNAILKDAEGNLYGFTTESNKVKVGMLARDRLVKGSIAGALQSAHQEALTNVSMCARYYQQQICTLTYIDKSFTA
jgi:hypothetical protein